MTAYKLILLSFLAVPVTVAQCVANGWVTKFTTRPTGNIVQGQSIAWANGSYWFNYTAEVWGELYFVPEAGGAHQKVEDGTASGEIVSASASQLNPYVASSVFLDPRGNGNYYMRGWADFECEVSPYSTASVGAQDSPWREVKRPVVSGNNAIWWLGGSADTANGYYNSSTLSADKMGSPGGLTWAITQGGSKLSLSCTICDIPTATSLAPSSGCQFDIKVQASTNGFKSEEYSFFVNAPSSLYSWAAPSFPGCTVDGNATDCPVSFGGGVDGYDSEIYYRVIDQCNFKMAPIKMNEKFTTSGSDYTSENWPLPSATGWLGFTTAWEWSDIVRAVCVPCTPNSQVPQSPLTGTKVDWVTQEIRSGADGIGDGVHVQTHKQQTYLDHGRHE